MQLSIFDCLSYYAHLCIALHVLRKYVANFSAILRGKNEAVGKNSVLCTSVQKQMVKIF